LYGFINQYIAMTKSKSITTTDGPIQKNILDELIKQTDVELILDHKVDQDGRSNFELFVRYNNGKMVRQVNNQRGQPRTFRDLHRALNWGKSMGFVKVTMDICYQQYPDPDGCMEDE